MKTTILSKSVASDSKKSRFIKDQEPTGLLSSPVIKTQVIFLEWFLFCFKDIK